MKCTCCGADLTADDRFCGNCGTRVAAEEPDLVNVRGTVIRAQTLNMGAGALEKSLKCDICGAFIPLSNCFECKNCGRTACKKHQDAHTYLCEDCEAENRRRQHLLREEQRKQDYDANAHPTTAGMQAHNTRRQGDRLWVRLTEDLEMEFVRVPSGEFSMGSHETPQEKPVHRVHLEEFWLARHPVTNAQYRVFVRAQKYRPPDHWKKGEIPPGKENHPVVWVSWDDAQAFCAWLSEVCGQKISLPTEAQWEKAARGTAELRYPWGGRPPEPELCNWEGAREGDTRPVGACSPRGDSPCGCADMAGNVAEWVQDWYDHAYYNASPGAEPGGPPEGQERVLRGGSWYDHEHHLRASHRGHSLPGTRNTSVGFRCAIIPGPGV